MDIGKLIKWIVIIVCVVLLFRVGKKWMSSSSSSSDVTTNSSPGSSCATAAARATERWGNGIGRFVNPPYDLAEWQRFHDDVTGAISAADSQCRCSADSCRKVGSAMSDFRSLVNDLDTSIRNGSSPPSDLVQRQDSINNAIEEAQSK